MRNFLARRSCLCRRAHQLDRPSRSSAPALGDSSDGMMGGIAMPAACAAGDLDSMFYKLVTPARKSPGVTGVVHGGQRPVSGAAAQLWQVGTTGYGIGATAPGTSTATEQKHSFGHPRYDGATGFGYVTGERCHGDRVVHRGRRLLFMKGSDHPTLRIAPLEVIT